MMKNGQTYIKNFEVVTPQDFYDIVWPFSLGMKHLNDDKVDTRLKSAMMFIYNFVSLETLRRFD